MASVFERLWCRTFQAVLKVGNYFMGYRMPHYLEEMATTLADVFIITSFSLIKRHRRCKGTKKNRNVQIFCTISDIFNDYLTSFMLFAIRYSKYSCAKYCLFA